MRPSIHPTRGFTLIELLIAFAVLGVLGAMAVPSFTNLYQDSARAAAVNAFIHTVFLARSEAIRRGELVSICKSADGTTCSKVPDWAAGWMVFVNHDRDELPERDADEVVLAVHEGWRHGQISANRGAFSFRPHIQGVVNGTLVFCDSRGSTAARAVIINHAGRPRVSRRDASNRPLRCPA